MRTRAVRDLHFLQSALQTAGCEDRGPARGAAGCNGRGIDS